MSSASLLSSLWAQTPERQRGRTTRNAVSFPLVSSRGTTSKTAAGQTRRSIDAFTASTPGVHTEHTHVTQTCDSHTHVASLFNHPWANFLRKLHKLCLRTFGDFGVSEWRDKQLPSQPSELSEYPPQYTAKVKTKRSGLVSDREGRPPPTEQGFPVETLNHVCSQDHLVNPTVSSEWAGLIRLSQVNIVHFYSACRLLLSPVLGCQSIPALSGLPWHEPNGERKSPSICRYRAFGAGRWGTDTLGNSETTRLLDTGF